MALIRIKEAAGSTIEVTNCELVMIGGGRPNNANERELAATSGVSGWIYEARWRGSNGEQIALLMTREERDELAAEWELKK